MANSRSSLRRPRAVAAKSIDDTALRSHSSSRRRSPSAATAQLATPTIVRPAVFSSQCDTPARISPSACQSRAPTAPTTPVVRSARAPAPRRRKNPARHIDPCVHRVAAVAPCRGVDLLADRAVDRVALHGRPSVVVQFRQQLLGRRHPITIAQDVAHFIPFDILVEPNSNPTTWPDVWRREKLVRRSRDHQVLIHRLRLAPNRWSACSMMISRGRIHRKEFVFDAKRRLAPRLDFVGFGE